MDKMQEGQLTNSMMNFLHCDEHFKKINKSMRDTEIINSVKRRNCKQCQWFEALNRKKAVKNFSCLGKFHYLLTDI